MARISVVLTSYNCAPYLRTAINSILEQSYRDFELLISDDCSTDGSGEIISAYAECDRRIRFFQQEHNQGLTRNYNFLFDRAEGELIAIQDADDWSDHQRLAKQLKVLAEGGFTLCLTGAHVHYPGHQVRTVGIGRSEPIEGVFADYVGLPATVMVRRSAVARLGGWPLYFEGGTSMDRYFLMEVLDGACGWHIGEPLYHARVRAGSGHRSWTPRKAITHGMFLALQDQRRRTGTDLLKERRLAELALLEEAIAGDKGLLAESLRESAVVRVDCGRYRAAATLLARAFRLKPTSGLTWRTMYYLLRSWLSGIVHPRRG